MCSLGPSRQSERERDSDGFTPWRRLEAKTRGSMQLSRSYPTAESHGAQKGALPKRRVSKTRIRFAGFKMGAASCFLARPRSRVAQVGQNTLGDSQAFHAGDRSLGCRGQNLTWNMAHMALIPDKAQAKSSFDHGDLMWCSDGLHRAHCHRASRVRKKEKMG